LRLIADLNRLESYIMENTVTPLKQNTPTVTPKTGSKANGLAKKISKYAHYDKLQG
jgi:hypothetical protein